MHENLAHFLTRLDKNLRETSGFRGPLLDCYFVLEEFAEEEAVIDSLHQGGGGMGSVTSIRISTTAH